MWKALLLAGIAGLLVVGRPALAQIDMEAITTMDGRCHAEIEATPGLPLCRGHLSLPIRAQQLVPDFTFLSARDGRGEVGEVRFELFHANLLHHPA